MAIKARCGKCKTGFTAKDALAGRLVKCPKCKQPMQIPAKSVEPARSVATTAAAHNPLLDLLDEAGVESMPRGPVCENCGSEIASNAIICIQCGYNMATGRRLETAVFKEQDDELADVPGMTDAEKILAQAEKDIEDMPVSAYGQDFGDGSESILIAVVALGILAVLVCIGVGTIFVMDQVGSMVKSSAISFWASMTLALGCAVWITLVAFLTKPTQGIVCICTAGLYCVIFGFMQGRALLLPTVILCAALLIGFVSSFFAFAEKNQFGMLLLQYFG